ncbi:hypothetical protein V5O48_012109 [Marasmius crinis-equi]|uniref:JmjC domain-containing protein n=1 Tax=Marasmius crinis-equi TaxID=585013 RepID=A0ABR3F3P8_9AGAR
MSTTCQVPARASVRLVERSTQEFSSEQQYWSTSSSSGGTRDPYPSEYNQPPSHSNHEVPTSPKRKRDTPQYGSPEDDGAVADEGNVAKKSKKPSSNTNIASGSKPPNSSSSTSKRGYSAKKRSEAAQMVAAAAMSAPPVSYTPNSRPIRKAALAAPGTGTPLAKLTVEVQSARCMSSKYKKDPYPRCVSCTRRWAGDTCRFQGVRLFMKDVNGETVGIAFVNSQREEAPIMQFPEEWNEELGRDIIRRTKIVSAKTLLPVLKREQEHTAVDEIIYRPRESEVRATCDTCMTSLFCSTWMCRICGRETCSDCFEKVRRLTSSPSMTEQQKAEQKKEKEKQMHSNPFFLTCTKRNEHGVADFTPVSRFCRKELAAAITEMEEIVERSRKEEHEKSDSTPPFQYPLSPPLPSPPPTASLYYPENPMSATPDQIPAHRMARYTEEELTFPVFQDHWRKGIPLLVQGLLPSLQIQWTPEYFIQKYGNQPCLVVECQTEENKRVTVGEFFRTFGSADAGCGGRKNALGTGTWKLKDWPPSTDFKTTFPELYEDFSAAVPIPQYVRRDGAMNISSHFPQNTIAPDLGPKMYNAMSTSEDPGSKGSTRLHMDMADALNIMTYASPFTSPSSSSSGDKAPAMEPGCAAWDLFRAEDANKLRNFLRRKFQGQLPLDPIHSQQVYLDREMRKQLYDEEGVKSYRIYQRPGEAVFIPAGVAHQVCNLSDCIKVAIDFVSPENVERCEQLTMEFREQNHSKAWKEDVLQLRSMLWFAWMSCCRQEEKLKQGEAARAHGHDQDEGSTSTPPSTAWAETRVSVSPQASQSLQHSPYRRVMESRYPGEMAPRVG